MLCKNCNAEIAENATFCTSCGTKVEIGQETPQVQMQPQETTYEPMQIIPPPVEMQPTGDTQMYNYQEPPVQPQTQKKKSKKGLIIALVSVAVILIAAVLIVLLTPVGETFGIMMNPLSKFEASLTEGDFAAALQIYNENLTDDINKREEAESIVISRAQEVRTAYIRQEMDYDEALQQLQSLAALNIVSADIIAPLISEINEMRTSRTAYDSALQKMNNANYSGAIDDFRKVIPADDNYADAQTQIVEAIKRYKEQVFKQADDLVAEEKFADAIAVVKAALLVVPDDADLVYKISEIEAQIEQAAALVISGIVSDAVNKSLSGDPEGALEDLESALKLYPGEESLTNAIIVIKDDIAVKWVTEADKLAGEGKIEEAIEVLENILLLIPNHELVMINLNAYKDRLPILIQDFQEIAFFFNGAKMTNLGTMTDNTNKERDNVVGGPNEQEYYYFDNQYKINGEYTRLTGVFFLSYDDRNETRDTQLTIYGDNNEVLLDATMKGGTEPIELDIDLTDVTDLRIYLYNPNNAKGRLADVKLHK